MTHITVNMVAIWLAFAAYATAVGVGSPVVHAGDVDPTAQMPAAEPKAVAFTFTIALLDGDEDRIRSLFAKNLTPRKAQALADMVDVFQKWNQTRERLLEAAMSKFGPDSEHLESIIGEIPRRKVPNTTHYPRLLDSIAAATVELSEERAVLTLPDQSFIALIRDDDRWVVEEWPFSPGLKFGLQMLAVTYHCSPASLSGRKQSLGS